MNKDNILFGIIGLLLGLIIGFMFANTINRQAALPQATTAAGPIDPNAPVPPNHPGIPGTEPGQITPPVQAAIDDAKNKPGDFDAQQKAGEFLYQIKRYTEALEYLVKANKLKPDDYSVIVLLGNAYFDTAKFEEAEKWYADALERKEDDINVRTDLGLAYMLRSAPDLDKAIEEFNGSLERDPSHKPTLQNLTIAYTRKGDKAKATETLARLEKLDPSNNVISSLRNSIQSIGTDTAPK